MRNSLDQDQSQEQNALLNEYATRHNLYVQFDVSDYDESSFASFSLEQGAYPRFTLIWDARAFVLTDDFGYTLARSTRLTEVLAALSLHLDTIRAVPHG